MDQREGKSVRSGSLTIPLQPACQCLTASQISKTALSSCPSDISLFLISQYFESKQHIGCIQVYETNTMKHLIIPTISLLITSFTITLSPLNAQSPPPPTPTTLSPIPSAAAKAQNTTLAGTVQAEPKLPGSWITDENLALDAYAVFVGEITQMRAHTFPAAAERAGVTFYYPGTQIKISQVIRVSQAIVLTLISYWSLLIYDTL